MTSETTWSDSVRNETKPLWLKSRRALIRSAQKAGGEATSKQILYDFCTVELLLFFIIVLRSHQKTFKRDLSTPRNKTLQQDNFCKTGFSKWQNYCSLHCFGFKTRLFPQAGCSVVLSVTEWWENDLNNLPDQNCVCCLNGLFFCVLIALQVGDCSADCLNISSVSVITKTALRLLPEWHFWVISARMNVLEIFVSHSSDFLFLQNHKVKLSTSVETLSFTGELCFWYQFGVRLLYRHQMGRLVKTDVRSIKRQARSKCS